MIPKSQNLNIFARKKPCACLIERLFGREIVAATIELNRTARFGAIKINYVAIHRMLSSKFPVLEWSIANVTS